jgi:peptide/nickel transport system permease protein
MWRWLRITIGEPLKREKLIQAMIAFLVLLYAFIFTAGFWAPYSETFYDKQQSYAAPTPIFVVDEHGLPCWPQVVKYTKTFDPETYSFDYFPDYSTYYPIKLFVKGAPYKLFGFIPLDIHLFGVDEPARLFLLGTDLLGQDVFSRLLYGGQISLTIGFVSLLIALPIGMLYGGVSGYLGGRVDGMMMRFAEIIMSIPQFYLLLSLATLLPNGISSSLRFLMVVGILSFIGWAPLSRVIRGMVLSYKTEEYIEAAEVMGASSWRIITRHLLPQTASFIIVGVTLGVPGYLLAESALSFLGLGIQPPDASWGNLLHEAQDLTNILQRPWLFIAPASLIFMTILSFNLIGDRLRDWLDPKSLKNA